MANQYIEMTPANVQDGGTSEKAFEFSVSLNAITNSAAILIPDEIQRVVATLSVSGGGKGKVQTTTDTIDTVKNGAPIWMDWDSGEVSANTTDACVPVTAIRLSQTFAGATKLTLRAQ